MSGDRAASTAAREEGNNFFRKGRWSDAAASYTRAIKADPADPVPYANRAQAWLKLERYTEAEADATSALNHGSGVKALYRRALARRALGHHSDAIDDLKKVLEIDPGNIVAKSELEEVESEASLIQKKALERQRQKEEEDQVVEAARAKEKAAPPVTSASGPAPVSAPAPAPSPPPTAPSSAPTNSFAALRKTRGTRPSYAGSSSSIPTVSPASPVEPGQPKAIPVPSSIASPPAASVVSPQDSPRDTTPGAVPTAERDPIASMFPKSSSTLPRVRLGGPASSSLKPVSFSRKADISPATPEPPRPTVPKPSDPTSTTPGAGLSLLRVLKSLSPEDGWQYMKHYPAGNIGLICAPVLEPDTLGLLLSAMDAGLVETSADGDIDTDRAWVHQALESLRALRRWKMNVAMLNKGERQAGERAWKTSGGVGGL